MRNSIITYVFAVVLPLLSAAAGESPRVCFTPGEDCRGLIVSEINAAASKVLVQAYLFSDGAIVDALVRAYKRGLEVRVIVDKSWRERKAKLDPLWTAGVEVLIDAKHKTAHDKVMVIDDARALTGSYNFIKVSQTGNAENLLVLDDERLARLYSENWARHAVHSTPYLGPDTP